jgi:hypothetical protein
MPFANFAISQCNITFFVTIYLFNGQNESRQPAIAVPPDGRINITAIDFEPEPVLVSQADGA